MSKGVLAAIIVAVIVFTLVVIVVVVMIILPKVRPPQNIQHNGNEPGDGHVITERRETPGYWISFHSLWHFQFCAQWYCHLGKKLTDNKAPSTRTRFCLKTQIFLFGLPSRSQLSGESFQKCFLEWKFFKTSFSYSRVDAIVIKVIKEEYD